MCDKRNKPSSKVIVRMAAYENNLLEDDTLIKLSFQRESQFKIETGWFQRFVVNLLYPKCFCKFFIVLVNLDIRKSALILSLTKTKFSYIEIISLVE